MNDARQRGGVIRPVELRAKPLDDAPTSEDNGIHGSRNAGAHLSGIESINDLAKLGPQIGKGGVTCRVGFAVFERAVERRLLCLRKVERASGVNGYGASEIGSADASRILAQKSLCGPRPIGARE